MSPIAKLKRMRTGQLVILLMETHENKKVADKSSVMHDVYTEIVDAILDEFLARGIGE